MKLEKVNANKGGMSNHHHIMFDHEKGHLKWILKDGVKEDIERFFYREK